ncbi:MAG: aldo/keto reductase [Armatimonadetes bacterium]|nr:aldo/keto reductase [Armatimonadota bacterium]
MSEINETTAPGASRREFMVTTGAVVAASGLVFGDWTSAQAATGLPKRKLGRTGLNVTALSFGGIQVSDASHRRVVDYAIDNGINYIHTCPGYTGGKSIEVIGEVMRAKRDKVYLAIKCSPGEIDGVLRTLNTDHIDVMIPDTRDFSDREKEAYAKLRQAGKIRFSGYATHNGMAESIRNAVTAGWRDVVLVKYNVGNRAELDPVIKDAVTKQKMGFMAMKVAEGAGAFTEKIVKLLKGNPNLTTVTPGMNSVQQVKDNIAAVSQAFAMLDLPGEQPIHTAAAGCTDCGHCAKSCPQRVAVADYLRADLYKRRGDTRLASDLLRSIPQRHSLAACTGCSECNKACPQRIDVLSTMRSV